MTATEQDYWEQVVSLPSFSRTVRELSLRSVTSSMPAVERHGNHQPINWNRAVFVASLVTADASETALDGALRITQGCLQDASSGIAHKTAARVLLERLGNRRSVDLAIEKDLLPSDDGTVLAAPLELDLIRRELQFTVDSALGNAFRVNAFQEAFWRTAQSADWVSVSAPTSAGKSFIVKQWVREQLAVNDTLVAVYLVPTRALVEEVSNDLRRDLRELAEIYTLPWDRRIGNSPREVFVLTQERLHILQHRSPGFAIDLLFVDEAQKFGDGARGVLLQRVVSEALYRRPEGQVLFASALASNPEILIEGALGRAAQITSGLVTVNQNLIYAEQVRGHPMQWTASVAIDGELVEVGTFTIPSRANAASKRLPLVAVALSGFSAGNVIYANSASEAEKMAQQVFDSLGSEADISGREDISALRELVARTIHPQYALTAHLARGIAFHYGNMPLLVRQAIEALFRKGILRYLICTSTLLEGVNLPCKNLFARAPRKGRGNPMTVADFWNLAGRAGRWGIEFQGNIVCVDASDPRIWPNRPLARVRQPITRATDDLLRNFDDLLAYCQQGTPVALSKANPGVESLFSLLVAQVRRGRDFTALPWLPLSSQQADFLQSAIVEAVNSVALSEGVTSKHAGISPLSMQRLYEAMLAYSDLEELAVLLPEDDQSVQHLIRAMVLIDEHLGGSFGSNSGRHWQLAILINRWMRGRPLALLVSDRVNWTRLNRPGDSIANVIRAVMNDVEQIARFEAPLYLGCFSDILTAAMTTRGVASSQLALPDITMMLELGVSRLTEVSMMSLGLSRTTTVALSELVMADNLAPEECLVWLRSNPLDSLELPLLVLEEIRRVIDENPVDDSDAAR